MPPIRMTGYPLTQTPSYMTQFEIRISTTSTAIPQVGWGPESRVDSETFTYKTDSKVTINACLPGLF